jgi:CheY-like chemotaxis protein
MNNNPIINNILIVDDDIELLIVLKRLFEKYNYNVVTAVDGKECLKELEKGFVGIIILDVIMPVMDGLETIKNMIHEGFIEFNKIILLTAKQIQGKEFDEIYPYINKYINKPFDIDELIKAVDELSNIENGKNKNINCI